MLSTDKHCEMLSNNIRDKSTAMYDGFKLFIQMFSSVVGGSVLLRLQYAGKIPPVFIKLSDWVVSMVVIATGIIVVDHYRSWRGYRCKLSKFAGDDPQGKPFVPPPTFLWSGLVCSTMIAGMVICLIGFWNFNPLKIPN